MLNVIIIEGPRGSGKSTVARELRNQIDGLTLINPTGFKEDGKTGLDKITDYYQALDSYLNSLARSEQLFNVLFDRTFFSECVYSNVYKSYDFLPSYSIFLNSMLSCANHISLYYLTVDDDEELAQRLTTRNKVGLFDNLISDDISNIRTQQLYYDEMFRGIKEQMSNRGFLFRDIDTSNELIEGIVGLIKEDYYEQSTKN